jgi:hypothetical protein
MMSRALAWCVGLSAFYFICVFGFPVLYSASSGDYMYTSDAARSELYDERVATKQAFDDSLVDRSRYRVGNVVEDGWQIEAEGVRLEDISFPDDSRVRLEWSVPIEWRDTTGRWASTIPIATTIASLLDVRARPALKDIPVVGHLTSVEGAAQFPGLGLAFLDSVLASTQYGTRLEGGLNLPLSLETRLRKLQIGERGHPTIGPEGYSDFLYFSVVTITTLGFGDVIPINARGRRTVGAEALVGVFVLSGIAACFGIMLADRSRRG